MLSVRREKAEEIPYVHYELKNRQDQKPVMIILYHGWGSSVHNIRFLASTLARWGYSVITPEILYHDSRNGLEHPFKKEIQERFFWETIIRSLEDIKVLTNHLYETYCEDLVLFGSSMGGMMTSGAFVRDSKIKGFINMNGAFDWIACEEYFQSVGFEPSTFLEEIRSLNPANSLERLNNRPLLMMNGSKDYVIPSDIQHHFYKTALPYYNDQNKINFSRYEGVQHTTTLTMVEEAVHWLEAHFSPIPKPPLNV